MPLLHLAILALVQGITELLPISSSAHLVLTWEVFGRVDPSLKLGPERELVLDIASHVGTLFAICLYFRQDLVDMIRAALRLLTGRIDPAARLIAYLAGASVPAAAAGLLLQDAITESLRLVVLIGWTQVVYGLLLWVADRSSRNDRTLADVRLKDAVIIGLAQALALVPGTSRSGITMTAGRFLGLTRPEAARFSFLIAIPTIFGAGLLGGWELYRLGSAELGLDAAIAALLSFFASLAALAFLMALIRRISFTPFVVYRVLLGIMLLALAYSGWLDEATF